MDTVASFGWHVRFGHVINASIFNPFQSPILLLSKSFACAWRMKYYLLLILSYEYFWISIKYFWWVKLGTYAKHVLSVFPCYWNLSVRLRAKFDALKPRLYFFGWSHGTVHGLAKVQKCLNTFCFLKNILLQCLE